MIVNYSGNLEYFQNIKYKYVINLRLHNTIGTCCLENYAPLPSSKTLELHADEYFLKDE